MPRAARRKSTWSTPTSRCGRSSQLFGEKAAQAGIQLGVDLQAEIPAAPLDEDGIYTCLANLVSNAIDACLLSDRKRQYVVTISSREEDGMLVYEVVDNGQGMDYEISRKVFSKFFTTKGSDRGTGLGLLTTKKIVHQHGGRISFTSKEGEGSVFRIELPRGGSAQAEPQAEVGSSPTATNRVNERGDVMPRAEDKTVLVVDDEPNVRDYLAQILRDAGFHVVTASDGGEALEIIRQQPPDFISLDLVMPKKSGHKLLYELRKDKRAVADSGRDRHRARPGRTWPERPRGHHGEPGRSRAPASTWRSRSSRWTTCAAFSGPWGSRKRRRWGTRSASRRS